jgi:hypothetical protein
LRDADVVYTAAGSAVVIIAGGMQSVFRAVYIRARGVVPVLFATGKSAARMVDLDVNWNLAALAGMILAVLSFLLVQFWASAGFVEISMGVVIVVALLAAVLFLSGRVWNENE